MLSIQTRGQVARIAAIAVGLALPTLALLLGYEELFFALKYGWSSPGGLPGVLVFIVGLSSAFLLPSVARPGRKGATFAIIVWSLAMASTLLAAAVFAEYDRQVLVQHVRESSGPIIWSRAAALTQGVRSISWSSAGVIVAAPPLCIVLADRTLQLKRSTGSASVAQLLLAVGALIVGITACAVFYITNRSTTCAVDPAEICEGVQSTLWVRWAVATIALAFIAPILTAARRSGSCTPGLWVAGSSLAALGGAAWLLVHGF